MIDPESIPRLMAAGTIEVAPLAYMRGRTLNDAFVILDEAQNTTAEQMKMFLTRLGFGSKIVVTGDITQVDLPGGTQSGLRVVREILGGIDDVHFSTLTSADVVRHRLVGDIVDAYERWDASQRRPADRCRRAGAGRRERAGRGADRRARRGRQRVRDRRRRGRARPASAAYVLDEMGVNPMAELSVLCVDVDVHEQPARAVDGREGPDRRPGLPDGRARHRPARRPRAAARRCSATSCSARPSPSGRPGPPVTPWTTSCVLLATHGVLHLLGYDHMEPEEEKEMFGLQQKLIDGWRGRAPGAGDRVAPPTRERGAR